MSTKTAPALSPGTMRTRRVPRYRLAVPLELTVLRSGIPDSIPGRTLEMGEGGMGVVAASQLHLGESVRVEFLLPHTTTPVRATAVVRYQRALGFGLQFLRLPIEQQSIIRYWTRCECELLLGAQKSRAAPARAALEGAVAEPTQFTDLENSESSKPRFRIPRMVALSVSLIVVAAMLGWWRWQQEWKALEAQVPAKQTSVAKAQFKVPADAMQLRIRHQVMPEYPLEARQAGVQGTVVLDVVVSAQGAVTQVKFVSGPQELSPVAMDAVRWWRYEPYLVNGQPATVETNVAVAFRLAN
jgi:TonB family protein